MTLFGLNISMSKEGRLPRMAALSLLLLALLFGFARPLAAHFNLNVNIRVIHVEHLEDGLRVYLRLPTPYVLAPLIGEEQADGSVAPAPYTQNSVSDQQLLHYLDLEAIRADPLGLAQLIADGHQITVEREILPAKVEALRVYPALSQPPFATLEEAKRAFDNPVVPETNLPIYVGDSVTDVILRYQSEDPIYALIIGSSLNPGLEGQEETANLILDHFADETLVFRESGLLAEPVEISRSALDAAVRFIKQGVIHILEGWDHVLFVLCLTVGAIHLGALLWRVTGFTIGHSITLILGFFGFVPQGAWFIPAVETGIALSIIYAGVIALLRREGASTIAMTAVLGLLHGLGFSFVLHQILNLSSPNLWQSLLSFNVGVELGQLAIVLLIWPLFWLLGRYAERWAQGLRWIVVLPCIAVAASWTAERALQVIAAL